jgi:hypothetical protein
MILGCGNTRVACKPIGDSAPIEQIKAFHQLPEINHFD